MECSTYEDLLTLAKAGANVIHIASYEWQRVRAYAVALARDLDLKTVRVWSTSRGLQTCDEGGSLVGGEEGNADPIAAMKELAERGEGGLLLLEDVHPHLRDHHEPTRWVREFCRLPSEPRRQLLVSTPFTSLPPELAKEVPTLELPLPDVKELEVVAREVAGAHGLPLESAPELIDAARGLTVMEARLAFAQAALRLGRLGAAAVPLVAREKERVIRQSRVLEYFEPDAGLQDVGGLDQLKQWLDRRGKAFTAGARRYGLEPPKGVLLLGVQGCGKSLVAKAIASAWQFPLLRFDLGKVFGGVVGESESNIRSALQVARALAPCVLWIDEIEKGVAGMGSSDRSDAGTTARVVGTLLTWMQEKKEPVFVVATANRIDMLPPELLRKGRFDEIFFVDLPTQRARVEILDIHLKKKQLRPGDFELDKLAAVSAGYSGAELEEAIREGMFEAFADGKSLTTEHVQAALRATFPLSQTMRETIEQLRTWASVRARLATSEKPEPLPPAASRGGEVPRLAQESRNPFIPPRRGVDGDP